ncbi:MAG: DUF2851 family protein [Chloroflexi bacterium]|nr:DUF2851 family protein [Chloroflexota bacterium]
MWQRLLRNGSELTTDRGETIEILYPGRPNDGQGADFRDAVITTVGGLLKGDIEIHVRSSDWRAHQHHHNPIYNRVILHVVWRQNSPIMTRLQNGGMVPTLVLCKHPAGENNPSSDWLYHQPAPNKSCSRSWDSSAPHRAVECLESQGDKRFLIKASRFKADIAQYGPGQTLYQGIMGALGYAKNKLPFLELARRLPLPNLEVMALKKTTAEGCLTMLQALLLGTAGLLPSQQQATHPEDAFGDRSATTLEKQWASFNLSQAMPTDGWDTFRVRPANHPVRRITAISHLVLRYRKTGLLTEMLNLVHHTPPGKGYRQLEAGLMVTGLGSSIQMLSPLLGKARAADIVVNVLLPFTFAWGRLNSQRGLKKKSLELYKSYPRLVTNSVEQHMLSQLGFNSRLVDSARRQQGLIHTYNTLCTQGKCHGCPLSTVNYPSLRPGITSKPKSSVLPA